MDRVRVYLNGLEKSHQFLEGVSIEGVFTYYLDINVLGSLKEPSFEV